MAVAAFALPGLAPLTLEPVSRPYGDELLSKWAHYLGPCNRPFGVEHWILTVEGEPVSLAVSASIVSASVARYEHDYEGNLQVVERWVRGEVVELARLASAPGASWATRPMLRLWREVCARRWPYWSAKVAIAYSANARHKGDIYRFDGWEKLTESAGSSGGGAWSRKRYATDAAYGRKTLWLWRYQATNTPGAE